MHPMSRDGVPGDDGSDHREGPLAEGLQAKFLLHPGACGATHTLTGDTILHHGHDSRRRVLRIVGTHQPACDAVADDFRCTAAVTAETRQAEGTGLDEYVGQALANAGQGEGGGAPVFGTERDGEWRQRAGDLLSGDPLI